MKERSNPSTVESHDTASALEESKAAYLRDIRIEEQSLLQGAAREGGRKSKIIDELNRLEAQGGPDPFFPSIESQMDAVQDVVRASNEKARTEARDQDHEVLLKIIGKLGGKRAA